jgi:isopropylmalate/homocitrate/citramalate synthase
MLDNFTSADSLLYDWNRPAESWPGRVIEFEDETLRDGLQSPSVLDPELDDKLRILHLMHALGIQSADLGLPGAGARAREHVLRLCREIAECKMPVVPLAAARTLQVDLEPVVEISQATGIYVEAAMFIGSSPIRMYTESWPLEKLLKHTRDAVTFAVRNNIGVLYVTEDTTRAHPDTLRALYTTAIEAGARRICLSDTCGHATPHGVRKLVHFIRRVIRECGVEVKIDWHGHRDRGLAIANALAAIEAGADRIHGTAVGVGERVGNTPLDLLLINLQHMGLIRHDLSRLREYTELVREATGVPIPPSWPVSGEAIRPAALDRAREVARRLGLEAADDVTWLAWRLSTCLPNEVVRFSPDLAVAGGAR